MERQFRLYIQVLTQHHHPSPVFVVAMTGGMRWLRVEVPTEVWIKSPRQLDREIGRIIRTHYSERKGNAVAFGKITGYVFHASVDRAIRYSVEGVAEGGHKGLVSQGVVGLELR